MAKPMAKNKLVGVTPEEARSAARHLAKEAGRNYSDALDTGSDCVGILGPIGAGKTFLAATASEMFPKKLPAGKMVTLDDMIWLLHDRKGTAGFKHNNLRVPVIDFHQIRNTEAIYRKHGYTAPPNAVQTTDIMLKLLEDQVGKFAPRWVVNDTVSSHDFELLQHNLKLYANDPNKFEPYKQNLSAHGLFYARLRALNVGLIFLFHAKAAVERTEQDRQKSVMVKIAGGSEFVPDITGQAAKIYKRDETLQLVILATRDPRSHKIIRKVFVGINDKGWEGKNRYEGLLPDTCDPDLRPLLDAINKGAK